MDQDQFLRESRRRLLGPLPLRRKVDGHSPGTPARHYLVGALLLAVTTTGCSHSSTTHAREAMPSSVPAGPVFASAAAAQKQLAGKGLPCTTTTGENQDNSYGSTLTCTADVSGEKIKIEISVVNHPQAHRKDIAASIKARRGSPTFETLVAAGNWYVWIQQPARAQEFATALGGVVLPAQGGRIPAYPLPKIPSRPTYRTVGALADALDAVVGCADRSTSSTGVMTCTTGSRVHHPPNCATISLYRSAAARDAGLRAEIAYKGVPASLVTAGNWAVDLCDYGLADRVATALKGVTVAYNGA